MKIDTGKKWISPYDGKPRTIWKMICSYCNEEYETHKSWTGREFCSSKCSKYSKRVEIRVICSFCHNEFIRTPSKTKQSRSGLFFCSKECKNNEQKVGGLIAPNHYGTSLRYNREGCCIFCGNEISKNKKYCTLKCKSEKEYNDKISDWKNGLYNGSTQSGISSTLRRYIKEKRGELCWICGWAEVNPITGNIPVEIDHIDGDCYNNKEDNLRLLCPSCHSLTPTFRNLNKNGKRSYRSKYSE